MHHQPSNQDKAINLSIRCPARCPVLSQIKPQAPFLVVPFRQFWIGAGRLLVVPYRQFRSALLHPRLLYTLPPLLYTLAQLHYTLTLRSATRSRSTPLRING